MKKLVVLLMLACGGVEEGDPCPRVQPDPCSAQRGCGFACVCGKKTCSPGESGVVQFVTCN